ncbi:ABC transporter substrate-binding protein [Paramesorhizobium deserti]|uniref:ABC transporter substrate-binding protein n=1 Tax=Paramesorhizobium deserti TaxID=1494590 RepID=A0A135HTT1_9HYPH|nr:ABC transporter substrate-binding protein [Paramesorhizobium deserti]KXF76597.1 ABC transporter substrate-binding protein [Paramesorhizobium deserti]
MQNSNPRRLRGGAFAIASLFGLIASVSTGDAAEQTKYPLTLQNCGVPVTFNKAPERAVTIGQSSTEILLSLGLADKMVGTAVWVGPVLKGFESQNEKIRRLADNSPSFESVVGQEPDLVAVQFEWDVGPNGAVGTREQFSELDIPTYVSPADCVAKDNSGGGDGVRKVPFTMELVYQEIRELAGIFDVQERGEQLVADLKKREAEAIASVAGTKAAGLPIVFWFSSKDLKGDAFIAGKNGAPAYILQALGAKNVIDTEEEWPLVSWETIVGKDPAVIVIAEMDRRRYAADDPAVKIGFLESDPVTGQLDTVRKKHFVMMDAQSMNPTIRTIDGIEALADGIRQFGLTN